MIPRALGNSPLHISPVAIGNMSWPGCDFGIQPGPDEKNDSALVDRLVGTALGLGITTFDTAEAYGCGRGEELLGAALKAPGRRAVAKIVTKVGPLFGADQVAGRRCRLDSAWVAARCEGSLKRLCTDHIDLYLAHWPDPDTQVEETIDAFSSLQRRGLIRAFGVSNFSPERLRTAAQAGQAVVTQNAYSLVERDFEPALLPVCREKNISLMAYSPLAKGILSGRYTVSQLPPRNDARRKDWHFAPENLPRHVEIASRVQDIAVTLGITPSQLALAWCLTQPQVASTVVGSKSEIQIRDAAAAGTLTIPKQVVAELDRLTHGAGRHAQL